MPENNGHNTNPLIVVLIIGLIGLSFLAGSLWTKVKRLENSKIKSAKTETAKKENTQKPTTSKAPNTKEELTAIAKDLKLDENKFKNCLDSRRYANKVNDQQTKGAQAGVGGTPGNVIYNRQTKKAILIPGAFPFEQFKSAIDNFIAGKDVSFASPVKNVPDITDEDHINGNPKADIFLIEYSDYKCPYCKKFHPTAKQIVDAYNGRVAWVYRHFPLDNLHPTARLKAEASECAAELGGNKAFWEFTDKMFE